MNKFGKLVFASMLLVGLVGCASIGGISNKYVNNDKVEGVIYGASLNANIFDIVCKSIQNKDQRCTRSDKYGVIEVAAKVGYADGFTGIYAFYDKNLDIGNECSTGSSNCTYVKALVEKGKLGTVLEVASRPGDGKCHWSGMPRIGGTVCPAYNYDYSRDFNGIPR
jgi:hypothetical protein